MSSSNVDLVRSLYANWKRGDYSSSEWAHPEIEYVIVDGPSPATFTALNAMAKGLRELLSPWKDVRKVVDEYRELNADRVLVLLRYELRGKTSGLELDGLWTRGAEVVHIEDGRVRRIVKYLDPLARARRPRAHRVGGRRLSTPPPPIERVGGGDTAEPSARRNREIQRCFSPGEAARKASGFGVCAFPARAVPFAA